MENFDIIFLSTIVVTLFVVFLGYTIKEFINASKNPQQTSEKGPRADLVRFMGRLFDSPVRTDEDANNKIAMFKNIQRTISDMESDGVYFSEDVKRELQKIKDNEFTCEYSGLPSVKSYEQKK